MKPRLIFLLCLLVAPLRGADLPAAAGYWRGQLEMGNRWRTVDLHLDVGRDGKWIGSLLLGGATVRDFPVDEVIVDGRDVVVIARTPEVARFEGRVGADGVWRGRRADYVGQNTMTLQRIGPPKVREIPSSALPPSWAGEWEGTASMKGFPPARVRLRLKAQSDGTAIGTIDGERGENPLFGITINGDEVRWILFPSGTEFRGRLNAKGEIEGASQERIGPVQLVFKRVR